VPQVRFGGVDQEPQQGEGEVKGGRVRWGRDVGVNPAIQDFVDAQWPVNVALLAGDWTAFYRAMSALAEHPLCGSDTIFWFWDDYQRERRERQALEDYGGDW